MSFTGLLNMSCTRQRDTYTQNLRDSLNNRLADPEPDEATYACHLEQRLGTGIRASNREVTDGRELQISEYRLFLPAEADVHGADRIVVAGIDHTFEVDGPPTIVRNPRDATIHHVEAGLRVLDE